MVEGTPLVGLIEILIVVALCMCGVHIAITMGVTGLVFAYLLWGDLGLAAQLAGITVWSHAESYTLSMIPLFVFLGLIFGHAGIGGDAFDCFHKWMVKWRGGLALVATFTSALFGTICGSSVATIASIGAVSNPEMRKRGYDIKLRLGSITAAGQLAMLIPPSLPAIIYCILVEESVGQVFVAGLVPGIILTIFFAITIMIWVRLFPDSAPLVTERYTWKEKFVSLKGPVPIIAIFGFMLWGIYTGFFSVTEAAGIGVAASVFLVLGMRRFTWPAFTAAVKDALRISALVMFIVFGAFLFTHTLSQTGIHDWIVNLVMSMGGPPQVAMFLICLVFIVLGCFMDVFAIQVLFIPLFWPTVIALGYDSVWFGTLTVILIEIALITPPIAGALYVAQQLEPEHGIGAVIKGVIPFYLGALLLVVLEVLFPIIPMFLVYQMRGA